MLTPFVPRVKSLTLRFDCEFLPLWPCPPNEGFPPSQTLERIRTITFDWPTTAEGCAAVDIAFSDTHMYPSLKEVEVCSNSVIQERKRGRSTYKRLFADMLSTAEVIGYVACLASMVCTIYSNPPGGLGYLRN